MVERSTKKNELSFLDKFEGKTSKMGKQGISALIEVSGRPPELHAGTASNSKRPSGKSQHNAAYRDKPTTYDAVPVKYSNEINLDSIIPSPPARQAMKLPPRQPSQKERRVASISNSDYVPSFGDDSSYKTKTRTLTILDRKTPQSTLEINSNDSRYQQTHNSVRTTEVSRVRRMPSN